MGTASKGNRKFFIELPCDEYENTAMYLGVVEAKVKIENGREVLIPVAPENYVNNWPDGWYRDSYGGWIEVEGPARMLERDEWKTIIDSCSKK